MIELPSTEVHLWHTNPSDSPGDVLKEYFALLSFDEQKQLERFNFNKDRNIYLVTRALVRLVLSRYADVIPRDWRFSKTQYGRPFVYSPENGKPLIFNISHTDGIVVLALCKEMSVGIDVEEEGRNDVDMEFAKEFLSESELDSLSRTPRSEWKKKIIEFWTLKEAYAKAKGLGLFLPFKQLSFDLEVCPIRLLLPDKSCKWTFRIIRLADRFVVALAVRPNYPNKGEVKLRIFSFS